MKRTVLACAALAALVSLSGARESQAQIQQDLLAMERASMDGWLKGDSGPMLASSDPEITLFHVMTPHRMDGVAAVKELYASYHGRPLFDSYRIENPKVQVGGEMAILSYQLVTQNGDLARTWNATQVYQSKSSGWKVVHSHFSAVAATAQ